MQGRQRDDDDFSDYDPQQRQNVGYGRYHGAGWRNQQRFDPYRRQRNAFIDGGGMTLADAVTSSWNAASGPSRQGYSFPPAQFQN